ncbi:11707_t:CDS:1, partial [Cetraspora pellucida]
LSEGASEEEVVSAYKRLRVTWHPDKNGNSEESTKKFQKIQNAY